ncbi:nucleotide cyclase [Suillus bovinus]|uniref:nucleotide cyclase n=1 Tax=Suillus bovinus TaxID=48563 RepID=UPI001B87CD2A|nr:nucleotide cyclase [Suillus bovinus]KAG2156495.1 nucleotide cyclase [Suillus bovinus]
MHSTASLCSSRYAQRWGFANSNFNCNLNSLHIFGNQNLDFLRNNCEIREGNEGGRVLSNLSWLSHHTAPDSTTPSTHNDPEKTAQHHVRASRIDVNGMSDGITDTTGKNGSLATLMPDVRARQKDKAPSAISGQEKVSLVETIARLEREVPPPTGRVCLVFTDIRNSTKLWDKNPAMSTAIHLHNNLLLQHLLYCGGYIVKTEGDAFICAFPTTIAAVWWSVTAQIQLLHVPWPQEILDCEEGKEVYDEQGNLLARGLSVRMGIHSGTPACELDPITLRMDYFGSMVNRCARISASALGGQIMCSADVVREVNAILSDSGPPSKPQIARAIEEIRQLQTVFLPVGEIKLKGLEVPEIASLVYPAALLGRQRLLVPGSNLSTFPSLSTSGSQVYPSAHGTAAPVSSDQTPSDDACLET